MDEPVHRTLSEELVLDHRGKDACALVDVVVGLLRAAATEGVVDALRQEVQVVGWRKKAAYDSQLCTNYGLSRRARPPAGGGKSKELAKDLRHRQPWCGGGALVLMGKAAQVDCSIGASLRRWRADLAFWTAVGVLAFALVASGAAEALLPSSAGPSHRLTGDVSFLGGGELVGNITWTGAASIIDLDAKDGLPVYSLAFTAARADVHVRRWTTPGPAYAVLGDAFEKGDDERITLTTATLDSVLLHDAAHITLTAVDSTVEGRARRATLQSAREVAASVDPEDQARVDSGLHTYSLFANDQIVLGPETAAMEVRGAMVLALWNGQMTVSGTEGTHTVSAGDQIERSGTTRLIRDDYVRQIVWIVLSGADLSVRWDAPVTIAGEKPMLSIEGEIWAPAAIGNLEADELRIMPRAQSLSLAGSFELAPRLVPEAKPVGAGFQKLVQPYDRFGSQVEGDVEEVYVSGTRLTAETSAPSAVAVGSAALGLLAFAGIIYRYGPLAVAALYSRLAKADLLANPIRTQIYDIVRANPGISGRKIHKACGAGWGTVVYHLNRLGSGGLVQGVRVGRAAHWFAAEDAPSPARRHMTILLRSGGVGRVATVLASNGPLTADQLQTATAMARSSVYRALSRLMARGLAARIIADDGPLYHATKDLLDIWRQWGLQDAERTAVRAPGILGEASIVLE